MADNTYDTRYRNYFQHQAANLKSRELLKKRGVKNDTPNLPVANYKHDAAAGALEAGDRERRRQRDARSNQRNQQR